MSQPRSPLLSPRLRLALCLMVGAYPLIATILGLIGPMIADWPFYLRPLPIVPLMVLGMVFLVIPAAQRLAGGWIAGRPAAPRA